MDHPNTFSYPDEDLYLPRTEVSTRVLLTVFPGPFSSSSCNLPSLVLEILSAMQKAL